MLCIVISVLMVIQNKITSQFADTEHIHKKLKFCLPFHCIKPALMKFVDKKVMHRSLYEKVNIPKTIFISCDIRFLPHHVQNHQCASKCKVFNV